MSSIERARESYPYLARDLLAAVAARESFEERLDAFAKRRAGAYAPGAPQTEEGYWPQLAAALAPQGPPAWMPMAGLIEHGFTLEGGARGLRGLFTKEPSEKERRRVQKMASLAWRVLELVAGDDGAKPSTPRGRGIAMAMGSFGLTADELEQARPPRPLSFEMLELFGDVDVKVRRELLRGAWVVALAGRVEPALELTVRGVAARLEVSAETDNLRAEVLASAQRQHECALVAVELARQPARHFPAEVAQAWLEHLIACAAPLHRREELSALAASGAPFAKPEALPRLDSARKRQALCLAYACLLGHDPSVSTGAFLRAELLRLAAGIDASDEAEDAMTCVERYLTERVRELTDEPPASEAAPPAAPPAPPQNPALPPAAG